MRERYAPRQGMRRLQREIEMALAVAEGALGAEEMTVVPQTRPRVRLDWLDKAKGAGIILVVIGHAMGGLIDAPTGGDLLGLRHAFLAIYTFHMPLFFLLSGLLVRDRIAANPRAFAIGTLKTIVPAYFIWSVIQYTIIYAAGSTINHPVSDYWPQIVSLPWHTISQFWFLYVLLILHMLAFGLVPRIGTGWFLAGCAVAKFLPLLVPLPDLVRFTANQALFYALGVFLGAAGMQHWLIARRAVIRLIAIPVVAISLVGLATIMLADPARGYDFAHFPSPAIARIAWTWPVIPTALVAIAAVVSVAGAIPGKAGGALIKLGRETMPIYVMHIICIAGTRILLNRLPVPHAASVTLAIIVPIGLAGPLFAFAIMKRLGINDMLGLRG